MRPALADGLAALLATPALLMPARFPALTVALLAAAGGVHMAGRRTHGARRWRSPLRIPVLALVACALAATAASVDPLASLTKLGGLVLGVLLLWWLSVTLQGPAAAPLVALGLVAVGAASVVVGTAATAWIDKVPVLAAVTARLPRFGGGVHPNALAALVLMVAPLAAVLATSSTWLGTADLLRLAPHARRAGRLAMAAATGLLLFVLLLTQSRAGWLGGLAAAVLLAATAGRRARGVALAGALAVVLAAGAAAERLWPERQGARSRTAGVATAMEDRIAVWQAGLAAAAEHPLLGLGPNMFRAVVHDLYPLPTSDPGFDVAHAHNQFLQVALDVGLPGLVCYVAVLLAAADSWRLGRERPAPSGRLADAAAAAIVGLHVFGITDAVALGARIGAFFWVILAVVDLTRQGGATGAGVGDV